MKRLVSTLGALCALVALIFGLATETLSKDAPGHTRTNRLNKITGTPASTLININNVAGWIKNDGESANNFATGNSGVFFPRGTAAAIFQDGIVWGGRVNDGGSQVLRVGGQTYSSGMVGGRIISPGVAADPNAPDVRIYRVRKNFHTADLTQDAAEVNNVGTLSVSSAQITVVRDQYRADWIAWPASQGAPFYDADGDGAYTPGFNTDGSPKLSPLAGETFDPAKHADEPGIANADQVIWFVCNDLNPGVTNALYGSNPIGLELQVTLWGYDRTDPLANVYFKKFTFIYKGTATTPSNATITDMFVAQWSDPDLGNFGDDFVGCDTSLSMAYVYNSAAVDNQYAAFGLAPPAMGYDFLQGPIVAGAPTDTAVFGLQKRPGFRNLPMTAAFYFSAGGLYTDPPFSYEGAIQWYNLLRGLTPIDGTPFTHPATGSQQTKFWLDGDPVTGSGRVDGVIDGPADRRFGLCSGPITMALGDTQEVVVGVLGGIAANYLQSISVMKNNDVAVQNAYNDLFDLPTAPPSPKLAIVELDQKLILDWGFDDAAVHLSEDFNRKGYTFQGYNLYQLPSASATLSQAIKLGTFDVADGVRTIFDDVFNPSLGIIERIIKQTGTDAGVRRLLEISRDQFRSFPLVNGQRYYFAVTSYGYNPDPTALTHALESSLQIVTAIPQSPKPGDILRSSYGDTIATVVHTGPSDGFVQAIVTDPRVVTGHVYRVVFDTVTGGGTIWHFDNTTTSQRKLQNQVNQSGDELYNTVDGLQIKVFGAPNDTKDIQHVANPSGPLVPLTYAAWGCDFNGWCFPTTLVGPTGPNNPGAVVAFPEADWGGGQWGIHTGGIVSDNSYSGRFVPRVFRNDNFDRFVPYDFELRFTAAGGSAWLAFTSGNVITVPFEIWNIGINTPTDPSDDYRMIPWVNDEDGNNAFNLQQVDHGVSGGDNDPYTDWIYWYNPTNKSPGEAGYQNEFVARGAAYDGTDGAGNDHLEVMARVVLANWNGGSVSDPTWPANVNSVMPATGNIIRIVSTKPNQPFADEFVISTANYAASYSATAAKTDVTKINVFPNPYYGFNRAETSKFARFVTFNHMPQRAEIRVFNLAGALVKSIMKDDNTQFTTWDLTNSSGLPVASGLYIVYVNMPDLGVTKTLKVIVIQEQQFLDFF